VEIRIEPRDSKPYSIHVCPDCAPKYKEYEEDIHCECNEPAEPPKEELLREERWSR
jgi:hypothetical protein